MKSSRGIDLLLRAATPKPARTISPDFTNRVLERLDRGQTRRSRSSMLRILLQTKLAPLTVSLAVCMCVLVAGTVVYATFNGWPNINAIFSGETHEPDGGRVVKVDTANCTSLYVPLAFQHTHRQQHGTVSYYFRLKKDSKLSNDEVVRMVHGYCEYGQQTAFEQSTVIPELERLSSNQNAQIFGLYASSTVESIDENSIEVLAHVLTNNNVIKAVRFSFKAIDPAVVVYNIDRRIRLQDIQVGDNVTIKYRVPPSDSSQELTIDRSATDNKTVVAITKNPPNIVAALDYLKYRDVLIEVTPCSTNPSGYCTADEFTQ